MTNFNNQTYEKIVTDVISMFAYIENQPNSGKRMAIRRYAEVVVRRLLDIPSNKGVTLGNKKITKSEFYNNNILFSESVDYIQKYGSESIHTNFLGEESDEKVKEIMDKLLNLLACLFIQYFENYSFAPNNEVLAYFSILPPIIRVKVLQYLFTQKENQRNINLIDKLNLAILKDKGKDKAIKWVEDHKDLLSSLSSMSEEDEEIIEQQLGQPILLMMRKTMYDSCYEKINKVGEQIERNGHLYKEFEESKYIFETEVNFQSESKETQEFLSIMKFIYLGRRNIPSKNVKNWRK